jgi:hypothetical protein
MADNGELKAVAGYDCLQLAFGQLMPFRRQRTT